MKKNLPDLLAARLDSPTILPSQEPSAFFQLMVIFKSWFWRYFDHFFLLVFYNFCWVSSCFGVGWLFIHLNFNTTSVIIKYLRFLLIYIVETIISVGWAYLVFRFFIVGEGSLKDVWFGIKKYILKAIGVSVVSGFVIALVIFNIRFYFFLNNSRRFTDFLLIGFIIWVLFFWLLGSLYHWPILFFQNPPFLKIFYKSFLLSFGNWSVSSLVLIIFFVFISLFFIAWPLWFFLGGVFLFSFQCVVLEKNMLEYKITYCDKPLEIFLETLNYEQQRGWREFFKPWENR